MSASKDMLVKMFEQQQTFQLRLANDIHSQAFVSTHTLAAIVELSEFLQETPWKPWKKHQELNKKKAIEELVDVWHFVINLSLAMGLTPAGLFEMFQQKHAENNSRQDRGY